MLRMRIACPHCQAVYEVTSVEPDVDFLCSRCHRQFHLDEPGDDERRQKREAPADMQLGLFDARPPDDAQAVAVHGREPPRFLVNPIPDADDAWMAADTRETDLPDPSIVPRTFRQEQMADTGPAEAELPPPERRAPRVLSWMSVMMLIIAIIGFAYNHRAWSGNLWLRSVLLNLHLPVTVHANDWRIPPDSVHTEWLKRDDGSAVLVIEGRVENLLHAELATPYIQVTVYDALHPDQVVKRRILAITQPPAVDAIRHTPWVAPPQDDVPVAAAGGRGFMLVMAGLPAHTGAFTLAVVPSLIR